MKFFIPLSALLAGALALPAASQGAAGGSCSMFAEMQPELESISASLPELVAALGEYLLLFFVFVCVRISFYCDQNDIFVSKFRWRRIRTYGQCV